MLIGQQFGRYEIRQKIGAGGMGEVYLGYDAELERNVAVKILPLEFSSDEIRKTRFRREARAASALNHPNIITIYEIGENEHGNFLITEFIDGVTLREFIKYKSLSIVRILKIVEQAARALVSAHEANIIHRDIKPENIMIRHDGIVKILDFGLAKPVISQKSGSNGEDGGITTIPGMVMGSARYMSPEQARGLKTDARTDIWSLGVVLYEMLTGNAPFKGSTVSDSIAAVIYKEPEPVSDFVPDAPDELQQIIHRALQKDLDKRYQNMKEFVLDLENLLYEIEHELSSERMRSVSTDSGISENPTIIHQTNSANHPTNTTVLSNFETESPIKKPKKRSFLIAGLLGVILLAALAFGAYHWFSPKTNLAARAFEKTQVSRVNTDGKVSLPAISPDGKYIAYASGESGNRSFVVRQTSTDSLVTVVPPTNLGFSAITFSPSSDYIYYCLTRGDFSVNTLYQVPILGGTPKKLIEDVDSSVTFSPGGKQFAFMRHTSNTNEDLIFVVETNSLKTEQLISTKQTDFDFFSARPAWSPDGTKILIGVGKRQGGFTSEMKIAEISIADKTLKTINTRNFYSVGNFCWFKDGSGFLFAGRETQNSPAQIWRSSYPSGEIQPVTNDFNDYQELGLTDDGSTIVTIKGEAVSSLWRFSPATKENTQLTVDNRSLEGSYGLIQKSDGKLVYTRNDDKKVDFWMSDATGQNSQALTSDLGFIAGPVVTPDGRYIVFNLQSSKGSRIWRMETDGKNLIQLTEENPNFADFNPQVTKDGKTVIFQRQFTENNHGSLMKISIDGGQSAPFYSDDKVNLFQPQLSPDGKKIVFSGYNIDTFERKLRVASINGDSFGQIEKELKSDLINSFKWSPDSKTLTIITTLSGVQNLMRLPIDGSDPQPITDFKSGRIFNFSWSNDGKNLFIVRGNVNNDLILIRDSAFNSNR